MIAAKTNSRVNNKKTRMIHVRLDEETHRRLRVMVASNDSSIQDCVATLVQNKLKTSSLAAS